MVISPRSRTIGARVRFIIASTIILELEHWLSFPGKDVCNY
ncbi:MAG: hypothetical protein ACUVTL_06100 [Thermoproteota archaeon]